MLFNKTLVSELNIQQKNFVNWCEKHSNNILNMSIAQIAKTNGVSTSFITKTLKKIGYYGLKDFRSFILANLLLPSKENNYAKYIQKTLFKSILASIDNIDELEISQLTKKIVDNNTDLYFIGEGFSFYAAQDQTRRYNKMGIRAFSLNSTDYQMEFIKKNDIVIFISNSGVTKSILETNENLFNKNINTYLFTTNTNIKNSKFFKIINGISYGMQLKEREIPSNSRIVILVILDYLFHKVSKILDNI